jgi:radical SAM superfamily enzyme YgiQ (UPF0313 family)
MKILFTIAQIDFADHIALAYLSAIARELDCRTYLCVLDRQNLLDMVQKLKPDVVAYSANIIGFEPIIKAHHEAKAECDFISILGGPQATFSPDSFEKSGVDAYCIGEGEYAFRDFLLCIKEKKSFDNIPNLITKKGRNGVRPLIRDINDLPFPDRDLTIENTFLKDTPKKTFYATRGCPYKCSYCCNSAYHALYRGKGPFLRRFSVERIIREIEYVKNNYRMDFIKFGDDCFALKADNWLEEFAEKYTTRVGIPFNCFLRIDTIDDALLKLLRNAGCHSVHLSVDSTSRHVREKILKRHMKDINIKNTLLKIRKYGINTWVNYMLAAPGATLNDDIESIWMSKKGKVTYPSYSTTVPTSGTELYDYCIDNNLIDVSNHKSDMAGCTQKSALLCFDEKQKNIRYNIYLVGALISKLPFPLDHVAVMLIKVIYPNRFFLYLRQKLYQYYIENKIFKLPL